MLLVSLTSGIVQDDLMDVMIEEVGKRDQKMDVAVEKAITHHCSIWKVIQIPISALKSSNALTIGLC